MDSLRDFSDGRKQRFVRERASVPEILPSQLKTLGFYAEYEQHPGRRRFKQRLQSLAEVTMSRRRSVVLPPEVRRKKLSTHSLPDRSLYTVTRGDPNDPLSSRKNSQGSVKGTPLSFGALAVRVNYCYRIPRKYTKNVFTEADEAERAHRLFRKFETWVKVIYEMCRLFKCNRLQRNDTESPFYAQLETIETTSMGIDKSHVIFFDPSDYKANTQMRMSKEGQRVLNKDPEMRTAEELHHVVIALRGVKLIEDLPLRMQKNLAKYSRFETYEPGRVIVKQHHHPEAFYFILRGTVMVAVLQESGYARTEVELKRGQSFGELSIMHGTNRQSSIITKTGVDLLSISDEHYQTIFMVGGSKNLHDPDQNQFLSNVGFLKGWPLDLLTTAEPRLVTFAYFTAKTVIVKDSNYSDWIFIIKSGSVTVLKKLVKVEPTINLRTGLYYKTAHRDGYLAFLNNAVDYGRYLEFHERTLPDALTLSLNSSFRSNGTTPRLGDVHNGDSFLRQVARANRPMTCAPRPRRKPQFVQRSRTTLSAVHQRVQMKDRSPSASFSGTSATMSESSSRTQSVEGKTKGRIRTFVDDLDAGFTCKPYTETEADLNPEFVVVQTLTRGQAFGVAQAVFGEQPSMCVISNGAECILINKKFYLENCSSHLMRRLKTQISPYPSDVQLQSDLTVRVDWETYKQCLVNDLVNIHLNQSDVR